VDLPETTHEPMLDPMIENGASYDSQLLSRFSGTINVETTSFFGESFLNDSKSCSFFF